MTATSQLKGQARSDAILALLTDKPMTADDVSKRLGMHRDTVRGHLRTMVILGKIDRVPMPEGVAMGFVRTFPQPRAKAVRVLSSPGSRYRSLIYASLRKISTATSADIAKDVGCDRKAAYGSLVAFAQAGYAKELEPIVNQRGQRVFRFAFVDGSPEVWKRPYKMRVRQRQAERGAPAAQAGFLLQGVWF